MIRFWIEFLIMLGSWIKFTMPAREKGLIFVLLSFEYRRSTAHKVTKKTHTLSVHDLYYE